MYKRTLAAIVLTASATPLLAGSCPTLMHEVDQALANDATISKLSESQLSEVRELRAQGEKHHKAGRHGQSVQTLNQAFSILSGS